MNGYKYRNVDREIFTLSLRIWCDFWRHLYRNRTYNESKQEKGARSAWKIYGWQLF